MKNIILRDTREKENHGWYFPNEEHFEVADCKLDTGDYTLAGLESKFIIERKGKLSEFATNINQARFYNEMERLESFQWPFIILEFSMDDLWNWPNNCGIPRDKLKFIRTTNKSILMKLNEMTVKYKTKFIFAGKQRGEQMAISLMKRVLEYEQHSKTK